MLYKANEPRRHKIPKVRYRVANWAAYDAALRRRGDLTIWVTPEAIAAWTLPPTGRWGRPLHYSAIAIETGLMLRLAFGRPTYRTVAEHTPDAEVIIPSRSTAVPSDTAETDPTRRAPHPDDQGTRTSWLAARGPVRPQIAG